MVPEFRIETLKPSPRDARNFDLEDITVSALLCANETIDYVARPGFVRDSASQLTVLTWLVLDVR